MQLSICSCFATAHAQDDDLTPVVLTRSSSHTCWRLTRSSSHTCWRLTRSSSHTCWRLTRSSSHTCWRLTRSSSHTCWRLTRSSSHTCWRDCSATLICIWFGNSYFYGHFLKTCMVNGGSWKITSFNIGHCHIFFLFLTYSF